LDEITVEDYTVAQNTFGNIQTIRRNGRDTITVKTFALLQTNKLLGLQGTLLDVAHDGSFQDWVWQHADGAGLSFSIQQPTTVSELCAS